MLRLYETKYVFGLPGETTLPLYNVWYDYSEIRHIMARDERSACFMADGYAKVSFKPGICEAPSPGATHVIPAVVEALKSATPMIIITTDIPLYLEKRNMLTGFDQSSIFRGITKESYTITRADEIPFAIRRAFRLVTTGKPGPVHLRMPMNILEEEVSRPDLYAQREFVKYPSHRFVADYDKINEAIKLLLSSEKPIIVCGQGVLYSQAWDEVIELAELLAIPVGTTINGKGSFPEIHPLSIGVIGARGGTSFSNRVLKEADLIFYVGCNTDSSTTDKWTLPSPEEGKKIIHLDISEAEVGNNYPTIVSLVGDAKATLRIMIAKLKEIIQKRNYNEVPRIKELLKMAKEYYDSLKPYFNSAEKPINPMRFLKELSNTIPEDHILVCDAGVSAIYVSAFWKVKKAGRSVLFNYSIGSLGYALPAAIGAWIAKPQSTVLALMGDGSFGFVAGELETLNRLGANIKVFLFNNQSFGWIRASILLQYGPKFFSTDFKPVDYVKIAEGFGLEAYRVMSPEELVRVLKKTFNTKGPTLIEISVEPEDRLIPPVPKWIKRAKELGLKYIY